MPRLVFDLTGQRFGKLTVIGRENGDWRCSCECGGSSLATGGNLRSGKTKSCGCGQGARRVDIAGQVFGRLTVLRREKHDNFGGRWAVRCECGTEHVVSRSSLRGGSVRSCGCLVEDMRRQRADRADKKAMARIAAGEKRCHHCKTTKPMDAFYLEARQRDGRSIWCRDCADDRHLQRDYGITLAEKQRIVEAQRGVCAIRHCGNRVDIRGKTGGCLDHCHVSGQLRAILCGKCNTALGLLAENPARIRALADYAESWKQLRLIPGEKVAK